MSANKSLIRTVRSTCLVVALMASSAPLLLALQGGSGGHGGGHGGGGGGGSPPADPEIAYIEDGDIWVMNADGSNKAPIFEDGVVYWVSWSPDVSRLAMTADIAGQIGIWTIDADGSNAQLLMPTSVWAYLWDLQWSPALTADGQEKILFIELTDTGSTGTFDVFAISPDGSDLVHLVNTPVPVMEESCSWSPDATRIAVIEGTAGGSPGRTIVYDLGLVNGSLAVIGATQVSNMPPGADDVDWARTQNKIAVSSRAEGDDTTEVWIINLDDPTDRQQVTFINEEDRTPTWAPDDSSLIYWRITGPKKHVGLRTVGVDGQSDSSLGAKQGRKPDWRR
jgi:Tol biopolymer transport system component